MFYKNQEIGTDSGVSPVQMCRIVAHPHLVILDWLGVNHGPCPTTLSPSVNSALPCDLLGLLLSRVRQEPGSMCWRACRGLPGSTMACRGLPGSTRACRGLPGSTRACRGLPGSTVACRALLGSTVVCRDPAASLQRCKLEENITGCP